MRARHVRRRGGAVRLLPVRARHLLRGHGRGLAGDVRELRGGDLLERPSLRGVLGLRRWDLRGDGGGRGLWELRGGDVFQRHRGHGVHEL